MTLAERAKAIAEKARAREPGPDPERFPVAREWWAISKDGWRIELFCHPRQTQPEVERRYPTCKVEAML